MSIRGATFFSAFGLILLAAICGCATPYQPNGVGGGYSESRIDPHTVTVSFVGTRFTPQTEIDEDLLYRSAEITHESGFDYFVLLDPRTRAAISGVRGYSDSGVSREALKDPDTYFPPQAIEHKENGETVMIRMLVAKSPGKSMPGYHAAQVIEALGPQLEERDTAVGTASLAETMHNGIPYTGDIVPDSTAMP